MLTVLGLAGSHRRGGNTETLLDWCLEAARDEGAEVVKFRLSDLDLHGCRACDGCWKDGTCVVRDGMQDLFPHLRSADSIVLAAPTYFMGMPAVPKMMVDRCQCFWALKYVLKRSLVEPGRPTRFGAYLSCSGTKHPRAFDGAREVVSSLWHVLEVKSVGEMLIPGVDAKGEIEEQPGALDQAEAVGRRLAGERAQEKEET
ncbi:MAG: flavodoxin family protein [Actinobacteria bacterium]|nr:flavodoxin family protein [Actinomycetota bacterium]